MALSWLCHASGIVTCDDQVKKFQLRSSEVTRFVCPAQRMAAETAQRRLQSELQELRQATDLEMHALRRQHQIAEDRLQREVLARQTAEQELLHSKRAQESADEAAQKARLYSSVSKASSPRERS